MAKRGKRIRSASEGIEKTKLYEIDEAVKLVKNGASAKFDETIEIAMNLGVDPRHADQPQYEGKPHDSCQEDCADENGYRQHTQAHGKRDDTAQQAARNRVVTILRESTHKLTILADIAGSNS